MSNLSFNSSCICSQSQSGDFSFALHFREEDAPSVTHGRTHARRISPVSRLQRAHLALYSCVEWAIAVTLQAGVWMTLHLDPIPLLEITACAQTPLPFRIYRLSANSSPSERTCEDRLFLPSESFTSSALDRMPGLLAIRYPRRRERGLGTRLHTNCDHEGCP